MSKLNAAERDKLPAKEFGLPAQGKYPMPDASHAANAKARATQQEAKSNLTAAQKAAIDEKADKVLDRKETGGPKEGSKAEEAQDAKEMKAKAPALKNAKAADPDNDGDAGSQETAAQEAEETMSPPMSPAQRLQQRDMQRMSARKSGPRVI